MIKKLTPYLVVFLYRLLAVTFRWRLEDKSTISHKGGRKEPVIWTFWHNRIIGATAAHGRFTPERRASVLASASKDGAVLADVMRVMGVGSVRGSTSKRGTAALMGAIEVLKGGQDLAITPDGPRGPVYSIAPGVVKVAELSGVPIMPVRVEYESCWMLKTWDRFRIPKPFTRVIVSFGELYYVQPGADIEREVAVLQELLGE